MPRNVRTPLLSTFAVAVIVAQTVFSQETSNAPEPSETERASLREQTIYIPYEKLRQTFEQNGRGVFLPYEKFQELWKAAREQRTPPSEAEPPIKAVVTEAANQAVVDGDMVRVQSVVTIDLLGEGWLEIPLQLSDVAIITATIDDSPARLVTAEDGGQRLLYQKDGKQPRQIELKLEYAKSFTKAPGQNSVSFNATRAPVNRWQIRVPESGVKVNVHPMLAATEVPGKSDGDGEDKGDNETVVMAFVGAAPSVRIDWTPKAEGASGLEALVSVQTEQQVTIDEGVMRTRTRLSYEISRAELSQLTFEVPDDQKVVDVVDANIRQWEVAASDGVQRITVSLFQPARNKQDIVVELEKFTDEAAESDVTAPTVKAVNVGRQRGIVVVRLAEGLRAEPVRRAGLLQLDTQDIPQALSRQQWNFSYRYAALPFVLTMRVEKIEPRISVDQLVEVYLQPQRLTIDLFAKYKIEKAGVFELELEIPSGFEISQVRGHAESGAQAAAVDTHTLEGENNTRLKVNLSSKALGDVGLFVELVRTLDDPNLLTPTGETSSIELAVPRVAGDRLAQSTGRLVVYALDSLRVGVGDVQGLQTISFDEAFKDLASTQANRFPELRRVLAYRFAMEAATADLTAERRKPQVTVEQLMVARIDPGVVKYEATFYFTVKYSSVKSLRLDVPAELAPTIRNETADLRESAIEPPPEDIADGYVAWLLKGETELIGKRVLRLTWEEPLADLGIDKSEDIEVPRLVPRDVDRAEGQIVLAKAETIDVQPKGTPTGLDPIDPQHDLVQGVKIADAAAALEFHDDWALTLTATRYQLEMLKATSISSAMLRMVVTRSDRISVQALYRMRSNRQRLEIQLPSEVAPGQIEFDTDPLRVNGRAVTLEQGGDNKTFFVPLVGHDANQPFVLELRYTIQGNGTRFDYPTFPDEPAVQKVYLAPYVPHERTYVGSRGPWTDEMAVMATRVRRLARTPQPRQRIGELISAITKDIPMVGDPANDFSVDGQPLLFSTLRPAANGALELTTFHRTGLNGVVFGVIVLLGVLLLRRTFVARLTVVCLVLAALVLIGVFLPTFAGQILDETLVLAGIIVLLLWFVVGAARWLPKLGQIGSPLRSRQPAIEAAVIGQGPAEGAAASEPESSSGTESSRSSTPPAEGSNQASDEDTSEGGGRDA